VPSPTGNATKAPIAVINNVALMSGMTPKPGGENVGAHLAPVKYSRKLTCRKNSIVSDANDAMIPKVVPIDTRAHRRRSPLTMNSPTRAFFRMRAEVAATRVMVGVRAERPPTKRLSFDERHCGFIR